MCRVLNDIIHRNNVLSLQYSRIIQQEKHSMFRSWSSKPSDMCPILVILLLDIENDFQFPFDNLFVMLSERAICETTNIY